MKHLTHDTIEHLHAADPAAGGVVTFLGVTRADKHPDGRRIVALDYEAYDAMADAAIARLVAAARSQFAVLDAVIVHRLGRVAVGEASVVVSVACAHRAEAFAACAWLMDRLKADVPVWKRDVWDDGSGSWTTPNREWSR